MKRQNQRKGRIASIHRPMFSRLKTLSFVVLAVGLCLLAGCSSSNPARLIVRPEAAESRTYSQAFSQAYVTRTDVGEYQAVLIDDGARPSAPPKAGGPLLTAPAAPVTQVVHIRVFWRPLTGTKADHPSATNAALDWYVFGDGADRSRNLLHYSGAGFVTVGSTKTGAKFHIRSASLVLKEQRGHMTDPIGPAHVTGQAIATTDQRAVRDQIAQIQSLLTGGEPTPQASTLIHQSHEWQIQPRF